MMKQSWKVALVLGLTCFVISAFAQEPAEKSAVVDRDLLAGVEDEAPVRNANENYPEERAYNYLLIHARKFSVAELRSQARGDLAFVHLFEEQPNIVASSSLSKGDCGGCCDSILPHCPPRKAWPISTKAGSIPAARSPTRSAFWHPNLDRV